MKKILITTLNMHYGKINNALLDFINYLDLTKYEVDLLMMEPGELLLDMDKNINILYYKNYMLMPNKLFYNYKKKYVVDDLYNQFRFAFKKEYDIAIAFNGNNNYVDMIPASVKAHKRIIWMQNPFDKISNKYKKSLIKKFNYFDNIVFTTNTCMENYVTMMPELEHKMICINNIIDSKRVLKMASLKTNINLGNEFKIVNISNLKKENNIDKLIDIHLELLNQGKKVKTYVVGDGLLSYDIAKKVRKYNIADSFIMLGIQHNLYNIMKQADLYVNLSDNNKFNNNLLEASILEVPFVSTYSKANKDILSILPNNAGKVCNYEDISKTIIKEFKTKKKIDFDYKKYNKEISKKIDDLLDK